ncbi:MAG: hypothetical protein P4L43_02640 [Syntrophobacteraceae bacterium]|nr:hypothetical protein [Syntrophobacteraceae bacterium]
MKMPRLRLALAALLVAAPAMAGRAVASPYTIAMLYGTSDNPAVQACAINNYGDIAGTYSSGSANAQSRMFLYSAGAYFTLPDAPNAASNSTSPLGINDSGGIVGNYYVSGSNSTNGHEYGFLYCYNTFFPLSDPNALPDSQGATWTEAHGINDQGAIVGVYRDSRDISYPYLYAAGSFNPFPGAPGLVGTTIPYGINNNGDVVGSYSDISGHQRGFLYSGKQFVSLDAPYAAGKTVATGINDNGEVVGWYVNGSGNQEGFLWNGGAFTTIDAEISGSGNTVASGINNSGQIVGTWRSADGSLKLGFVATLTALWRDAQDIGSGWKWLSWFGIFDTTSSPWIYHQSLGWLYAYGTSTYSLWFWDPAMNDFWWTRQGVYPYLYRAGDGAWLYYLRGSSNPRWFYNFKTLAWESR